MVLLQVCLERVWAGTSVAWVLQVFPGQLGKDCTRLPTPVFADTQRPRIEVHERVSQLFLWTDGYMVGGVLGSENQTSMWLIIASLASWMVLSTHWPPWKIQFYWQNGINASNLKLTHYTRLLWYSQRRYVILKSVNRKELHQPRVGELQRAMWHDGKQEAIRGRPCPTSTEAESVFSQAAHMHDKN